MKGDRGTERVAGRPRIEGIMIGDTVQASLAFALAMAAGALAQVLARRLLVPGIVVLLGVGVLLGPDVMNVVRPDALGPALTAVVGFSVAVILFEGGLKLKIRVLRRQALPIRRLVTVGALITAAGGALAAHLVMGWDYRLSILFGTLVIVTGPTVITPVLRQFHIRHSVAAVLEAEGIFIDAVGASIAVVALEIALAPSDNAVGLAAFNVAFRLSVGAAVGAAGGLLLSLLLRWGRLVPRGFENILALSFAVLVFALSNALIAESGIAAAIAAGLVVGNTRTYALGEIAEFKEQLTVLLIAVLFVLLAADVRVASVIALGWRGALTVLVLMFVVRPLSVAVCSWKTALSLRERLFMVWLSPRGIVAAAVASLFAFELDHAGIGGGQALKALVFLVIGVTVTVQGLFAGVAARALGVQRTQSAGTLILGANPLAVHVARRFSEAGEDVVLIESDPKECRLAQEAGLKVFFGSGLETRMLVRAGAEHRAACVALTPNESDNLLFAQKILDELSGPTVYVAVGGSKVTSAMLTETRTRLLFANIWGSGSPGGDPRPKLQGNGSPLQSWLVRFRRGVWFVVCELEGSRLGDRVPFSAAPASEFLPLLGIRQGRPFLLAEDVALKAGDHVELAVNPDQREASLAWLGSAGLRPLRWYSEPGRGAGGARPPNVSPGGNGRRF